MLLLMEGKGCRGVTRAKFLLNTPSRPPGLAGLEKGPIEWVGKRGLEKPGCLHEGGRVSTAFVRGL